jgi:hypothetical protein
MKEKEEKDTFVCALRGGNDLVQVWINKPRGHVTDCIKVDNYYFASAYPIGTKITVTVEIGKP